MLFSIVMGIGVGLVGAMALPMLFAGLVGVALVGGSIPRDCAKSVILATVEWWRALVSYMQGEKLESGWFEQVPGVLEAGTVVSPDTPSGDWTRRARVHTYALALVWRLWSEPHYRNGTFADDVRKNLRNVALPGMGVPLSYFAESRELFLGSALLLAPVASAVAAVQLSLAAEKRRGGEWSWNRVCLEASARYVTELCAPTTWYALWRLNCSLATYHAAVTGDDGYRFEDKEAFLAEARRVGLPTSPTFRVRGLIAKHRNEEGGLGFGSFRSSTSGGDWILQPWLNNHPSIATLLPKDAPLSTLRIVTMRDEAGGIRALACVWRAGRAGAATDHSSVMFDMDLATGKVGFGGTNAHWYQLGVGAVGSTPFSVDRDTTTHPDSLKQLTGVTLPRIQDAGRLCERAHEAMAPRVTFIGWDVALTQTPTVALEGRLDEKEPTEEDGGEAGGDGETASASLSVSDSGPDDDHSSEGRPSAPDTSKTTLSSPSSTVLPALCLLEANFSCNFFRATFDEASYYKTVEANFKDIHTQETTRDTRKTA